jgi:hypothetical protein
MGLSGLLELHAGSPHISLLRFQSGSRSPSAEEIVTDGRTYCLLLSPTGHLFAAGVLKKETCPVEHVWGNR